MLTVIQLILLAFILFALSRVYLRTKEKILSPKVALFWTLIWIAALIGVTNPATTTKIAEFFGVGRGVDIIVYLSLALVFYLVFRLYVMIEDLRHEITYLVREISLLTSSRRKPKKRSKK